MFAFLNPKLSLSILRKHCPCAVSVAVCVFFFFFTAAQNAVHSHYSQTNQASLSYNSYGGVTQSSGGAEADRPPSGTPSASVHSSPGHRQGKNESKSSLCIVNMKIFMFVYHIFRTIRRT